MHEFKQFIQKELDARGWRQADLVRASGLSRSLVSKLLRDDRNYLGQMPDEATLEGIAKGFAVPVDVVRTAASRALAGYSDEGHPLQVDLTVVSTDALLQEVRRRIESTGASDGRTEEESEPRTQAGRPLDSGEVGGDRSRPGAPMNEGPFTRERSARIGKAITSFGRGKAEDLNPIDQGSEPDDFELAAMTGETAELRRRRLEGEPWDQPDPDGPEDGA